jgi:two-component system, chemotaxis family, chemotaxis protein CheY
MTTKPFRVLLVDDSAPFRRQVGGALEASGLSVVEATEGVEAMWRARSEGVFDLVLLDIHMPNMDGLTFIRELRKLTGYSHVPIVVVTSDGSRERRLEGRGAGATAWLLKPPDLPGLINAVHASLMRIIKPAEPSESLRPRTLAIAPEPAEIAPRSELLPPRSQRARPRSEPSVVSLRDSRARTEEPPARFAPIGSEGWRRSAPPQSIGRGGTVRRSEPVRPEPVRSEPVGLERRAPRSERPLSRRGDGLLPPRSERAVSARSSERSLPLSERSGRVERLRPRSDLLPRPAPSLARSEQPPPRPEPARSSSEQPLSRLEASSRLRSLEALRAEPVRSERRSEAPASRAEAPASRAEPSIVIDAPSPKSER